MDLLKARERARKKAQEEKQEKREEEKTPSSQEDSGPASREEETGQTSVSDGPQKQEAPETPSSAGSESGSEQEPVPEETGESKDSAFVSMSDFSEEDVFCDDSFGEDLPSLPEQSEEKPEAKEASMLIDGEGVAGPEEKKAGQKEQEEKPAEPGPEVRFPQEGSFDESSPDSAPATGDTSLAWEVREHVAKEEKKPEPVETPPSREEGPPPEGEYSLEDMTTDEDDFFSLVTEELYMREFGAEGSEAEDQFSLLSFRLASETYAVRLTSIRQIIKVVPVTMVPRVPDYVLGIISLRGTVIPVFDLRRVLKLPEAEPSRKSRIVIVNHAKYTAGLLVDQVEQVVRMSESAIEPPPPVLGGVEAEYIKGIGRVDSKMVIFLALEKIMVPVG